MSPVKGEVCHCSPRTHIPHLCPQLSAHSLESHKHSKTTFVLNHLNSSNSTGVGRHVVGGDGEVGQGPQIG